MESAYEYESNLIDLARQGFPVPRVPVGFWFHFLGEAETGDASANPDLLAASLAGHRRYIESFKPDMIKIMSDGFFHHPARGPLGSPKEALAAIEPVSAGHPWIDKQVELVKAVAGLSEASQRTRRFFNIFCPSTTLKFMIGRDKLLSWLKSDPGQTKEVLDRIGESLANLAREIVLSGCDGVYYSVQNPDIETFSYGDYDSIIKPSELWPLKTSSAARGHNILHICGYDGVKNKLEYYQDYPAEIISWAAVVEDFPLGRGKRLFPGKCVLGGFANTPGSLIHVGSEEQIKTRTREILAESGREGVILGADCTVPSDIDLQRLEWVREAASERA
ncbi:MAG: uroporphyrinogen decarboxylase [Deltaproteobacteria bacterium]|jgi:uroporphyrinogen decarboxylase|nr:uroporphyrinogen decarboxylase [Deltaproteobacteria bacterium]